MLEGMSRWRGLSMAVALWVSLAGTRAATVSNGASVSLPYELRRGHVMIDAQLNGSNALPFMLDTGYGVTLLPPGLAEGLGLRRAGRITIVGIAGEEAAGTFDGPEFDFSGLRWRPRRVAGFPGEGSQRRSRYGILGSGFFRRHVVEIDPASGRVTLHVPEGYEYRGTGEVLPLTFQDTTPIVEGTFVREGAEPIAARFEFDLGCDGCLCLGRDFTEKHGLLPEGERSTGARVGVGGSMKTRSARAPELRLGKLSFPSPRASFFMEGSPVDAPLAGHVGYELLREHRLILDYARKRLIVERAGSGGKRNP